MSEVYGDGNVTFYNVVSLRYRVREMLLYVMKFVSAIKARIILQYKIMCV